MSAIVIVRYSSTKTKMNDKTQEKFKGYMETVARPFERAHYNSSAMHLLGHHLNYNGRHEEGL